MAKANKEGVDTSKPPRPPNEEMVTWVLAQSKLGNPFAVQTCLQAGGPGGRRPTRQVDALKPKPQPGSLIARAVCKQLVSFSSGGAEVYSLIGKQNDPFLLLYPFASFRLS